jgi:hypothetical protein
MTIPWAKQGHGDSLCGIYALLNAICTLNEVTDENYEKQRYIFRCLILAADRLGFVDAHHLLIGFEDFELVEVFNLYAKRCGVAFSAETLGSFVTRTQVAALKAANLAFKEGALVIAYAPVEDHWVLRTNNEKIVDSWPTPLVSAGSKLAKDQGVVISPIAESSSNAQTH